MDTRIKRYSKLRSRIDQEINDLKLKNENDQKLNYYKDLLVKIDANIFDKARKKTDKLFPNLKSLIQIEETNKKKDWQVRQNEIKKWIEVSENIVKGSDKEKKISDYIPNSQNEQFVKNNIQSWQKNNIEEKQKFEQMIKNKKKFASYQPQKLQKIEETNILKQVNKTTQIMQKFNQELKKMIGQKKEKTKWLFWLMIILTLGSIGCLITIFLH